MLSPAALLGYIGPETMLPVASVFAAIVGVVLMGWQFIVRKSKQALRFVLRKSA